MEYVSYYNNLYLILHWLNENFIISALVLCCLQIVFSLSSHVRAACLLPLIPLAILFNWVINPSLQTTTSTPVIVWCWLVTLLSLIHTLCSQYKKKKH